jgi:hypothetical protein
MKIEIQFFFRWIYSLLLASSLGICSNANAAEIVLPTESLNGALMTDAIRNYVGVSTSNLGFELPTGPSFYPAPNGAIALAPIVYLAGTYTFNFNLTQGTPLIVTSLFYSQFFDNDQSTDRPPCDVAVNRFACVQELLRAAVDAELSLTTMTLKIDGEAVLVTDSMRVDSNGVPVLINLPSEDVFGTPPGDYYVIFDGWFTGISGLSLGLHTIEYGFQFLGSEPFQITQISQINVVPVPLPASALLVLIGLPLLYRRVSSVQRRYLLRPGTY